MKYIKLSMLTLTIGLIAMSAFIEAEDRGVAIMQKVQNSITGFGQYRCDMVIELINKKGKSFKRETTTIVKEKEGDGELTLSIFRTPSDVKGTKLLSHAHPNAPDDQWLFLPSINRVKRIANENKSGPFLGSEIAFEDMGLQVANKFVTKYRKDTVIKNQKMHIVRLFPKSKYSGYSFIDSYITTDNYLSVYNEYHNKKNELFKTDETVYKSFNGKSYVATNIKVVNLKTGRSTVVNWSNYDFSAELEESIFIINNLNRVKF